MKETSKIYKATTVAREKTRVGAFYGAGWMVGEEEGARKRAKVQK